MNRHTLRRPRFVLHLGAGLVALLGSAPLRGQPAITSVVNAAHYDANGLVPGGIATLFGTGMVSEAGIVSAVATPLPVMLSGTQVLVNNVAAPLFAVANVNRREQINFQVPWETAGETTATVIVVSGGVRSAPRTYSVRDADPGVFTLDSVKAIVAHGTTNELVTPASPADAGEAVVFYATGLGAVDRVQQSGRPASSTELARTATSVKVTIGGRDSAVQFTGLTPGSIGLYQVNCTVPAGVSGEADVRIAILGQLSKSVKMHVRERITSPRRASTDRARPPSPRSRTATLASNSNGWNSGLQR